MWNLVILVIISSLLLFRCFGFSNLSTNSTVEIDHNRIFYSHFADIKDYPYDVSLCLLKNNSYVLQCTASLLTTKFVLTAAHCILEEPSVYVGLGAEANRAKRNYVLSKATLPHEKFELIIGNLHDIGLVELHKPVEPASGVTPIKLPSKADAAQTYMGYNAIVSGWGRSKHGYKERLKYLNVTIVTNDKCAYNITSNDVICGMGANFGRVCSGDSGGPLVTQNAKNEIIQIGIVSFGSPRCRRGFATFYTRITRFLDWIEKHSDYKFQ